MSTDMRAFVKNRAYDVASDGSYAALSMNRAGALRVNSFQGLYERWLADGRVFFSGTPALGTPETMSAAGTAFTLTAPALHMTIPSGLTVVPIYTRISVASVQTKDDIFAVVVGDTDTFTSGGEAMQAARNGVVQSNSAYRTTGVTNLVHSDTAIVEGALTRPRIIYTAYHQAHGSDLSAETNFEYNILKGDAMVVLEGPAVFVAYMVQETTAAEAVWAMAWAELDGDEY